MDVLQVVRVVRLLDELNSIIERRPYENMMASLSHLAVLLTVLYAMIVLEVVR